MPECTREVLELHARFATKTVDDGCPNCRRIRRMAVRTLNGSAIQARDLPLPQQKLARERPSNSDFPRPLHCERSKRPLAMASPVQHALYDL